MSRTGIVALVLGMSVISGCAVMEQYHYQPAFKEVPTEVKVAFQEQHPKDVIQMNSTMAEKMYDGSLRYRIVALDPKNVEKQYVYTPEGKEIKE